MNTVNLMGKLSMCLIISQNPGPDLPYVLFVAPQGERERAQRAMAAIAALAAWEAWSCSGLILGLSWGAERAGARGYLIRTA